MKYEFDSKPSSRGVDKFPRFMRSTRGRECIVLFTDLRTGMELTEDGFRSEETDWIVATDLNEWEPFTGTIVVTL